MSRPSSEQLRRLGRSLREIDPKMLDAHDDEGPVRWFLGENGTELVAWIDEAGAPHHIQLVFSRVSVEWTGRALATGTFDLHGSTAGGRYDPYLLRMAGGLDPEVCEAALELLRAADIDPVVKEPLLGALANASRSGAETGSKP
ncbi:MAG: hypothetical protein IRZ16_17350 [Myxococcaceae bacterium]|nr:hypothetical protein [Myxococcaceae bacterium]